MKPLWNPELLSIQALDPICGIPEALATEWHVVVDEEAGNTGFSQDLHFVLVCCLADG